TPVSTRVTVTAAPGTADPETSVIRPAMLPAQAWAHAGNGRTAQDARISPKTASLISHQLSSRVTSKGKGIAMGCSHGWSLSCSHARVNRAGSERLFGVRKLAVAAARSPNSSAAEQASPKQVGSKLPHSKGHFLEQPAPRAPLSLRSNQALHSCAA